MHQSPSFQAPPPAQANVARRPRGARPFLPAASRPLIERPRSRPEPRGRTSSIVWSSLKLSTTQLMAPGMWPSTKSCERRRRRQRDLRRHPLPNPRAATTPAAPLTSSRTSTTAVEGAAGPTHGAGGGALGGVWARPPGTPRFWTRYSMARCSFDGRPVNSPMGPSRISLTASHVTNRGSMPAAAAARRRAGCFGGLDTPLLLPPSRAAPDDMKLRIQ
jgi:hypothetical protein